MCLARHIGLNLLAALLAAAALLPASIVAQPPKGVVAAGGANSPLAWLNEPTPDLVCIALIDKHASAADRAAAQLKAVGLEYGNDFVRAAASGNQRLIQFYLTAGADPNAIGEQGRTPLLAAALDRDWPAVEKLLQAGANPKLADEKGLTPLMAAAIAGSGQGIEDLLAAGAPIDAVDNQHRLALGYAVALRQTLAVNTLLGHEVALPAAARGGDDLATAALETGDHDLCATILRRLPPGLTWTPVARTEFAKAFTLHDAILGSLILQKYAGPPASSEHAQPMLAYAVAQQNIYQVRELLDLGADPNTVLNQPEDTSFREWVGTNFMRYYVNNTPGLTVLMLAAGMKETDTVKMLLDHGANKNLSTRGKSSLLALYFACWVDSPETIQALLGDAPSKDEVRIEISLDEQRVRYYRNGILVLTSEISTGRDGYETKTGEYVITDKHLEHRSTLYHNASMPYFMRLSCQAFGLHAGYVTGRPASHGCIRLPDNVARRLFKEAPIGTWVSINR
jgi:ankyrin repeat protein